MEKPIELNRENILGEEAVYPGFAKDCKANIFINGYLVKTAYSINGDAKSFLKQVRSVGGETIQEIEIFIKLEAGEILVGAWEKVE